MIPLLHVEPVVRALLLLYAYYSRVHRKRNRSREEEDEEQEISILEDFLY
jgi:hypothetical protein